MPREADLVSGATRGRFRDATVASDLRRIRGAFHDQGFAPVQSTTYVDGSQRRTETQLHLEAVDWTDPGHVTRFLRAAEALAPEQDEPRQLYDNYLQALRRDGFTVRDDGHVTAWPAAAELRSLSALTNPDAILEHLDRIRRAVGLDPAQVVGSAKELVESTAKLVLTQRGIPYGARDDLPKLAKAAQRSLLLHADDATGPNAAAVTRILAGVTSAVWGLDELRNASGTGHGRETPTRLQPRQARLAVNTATTWCELILSTLEDPAAPWRRTPTAPQHSV